MSSPAALAYSTAVIDQPAAEVVPRPALSASSPRSTLHPVPETTTLDRLPIGAHACVVGVVGDDPIAQRLTDMGFWPGTTVHVVRQALLGDPVQYTLRGYRLALRRSEARLVQVSRIDREARSAAVPDREARSAAVPDREARSAAVPDREARSAAVVEREARSAAVVEREARSAAVPDSAQQGGAPSVDGGTG